MKTFSILLITTLCLCLTGSLSAEVPGIINYQGRVSVGGTNFDGTGSFKFALVNSTGATTHWTNGVNTVSVPVTKGLYSVLLGDTTIANMAAIPTAVFTNADVRLRVWFDDGVTGMQQLSPDQRLAAVGYALQAANVPGLFRWETVGGTNQQAQPNTGYIMTNALQVTITLPTAPNVGDILRVSGPGAGGWRIAQNDGQSVLTANLPSLPAGMIWTAHESIRGWTSVASSEDGNKLVALADRIYTSTDSGVTWTAHESNRYWTAVASSADGTKLVAVAAWGQIYTSTDSGVTWSAHLSNRVWTAVVSSSDGRKLVAGTTGFPYGSLHASADFGAYWTEQTSPAVISVASSAEGTKLYAALSDYLLPQGIWTSREDCGVYWGSTGAPLRYWKSVASSSDGSKLVAVVGSDYEVGQIYTSSDWGDTWTAHESNRTWTAVASSADGSKLVALDGMDHNPGKIYISTDSGVTWTAHESNRAWSSVASSADGNKLVAVDLYGQIYTSAVGSPAPNSATTPGASGYLIGSQGAAIELQYIGNNQFLPLNSAGTIVGY